MPIIRFFARNDKRVLRVNSIVYNKISDVAICYVRFLYEKNDVQFRCVMFCDDGGFSGRLLMRGCYTNRSFGFLAMPSSSCEVNHLDGAAY